MKTIAGIFFIVLVYVKGDSWQIKSKEITSLNEDFLCIDKDTGSNEYFTNIKESINNDSNPVNISAIVEYNGYTSATIKGSICNNDTVTDLGTIATIIRKSLGLKCPLTSGNYTAPDLFSITAFLPSAREVGGGQIPLDSVMIYSEAIIVSNKIGIFEAVYKVQML